MLTELETGLSFLPDNEKFDKTIILKIDIDDIIPNDKNVMSTEDIDELAESIHKDGLLNPLKVYKNGDGTYELFGGHRRYLALKKLVDEDDDFDPEVSCIVYKRPADELRERLQIIQDNAQRDMSKEDKKKLFKELNEVYDKAEADNNQKILNGKPKTAWISMNLGLNRKTIQRYLKELEAENASVAEEDGHPAEKKETKAPKEKVPENPDAPTKEEINKAKGFLEEAFDGVSISKNKVTFKFEDREELDALLEKFTGMTLED